MKEKKKTEIATNVSSGAEKVEVVERELKTQQTPSQTSLEKKTEVKKEAENKAAKARVDAALEKKKAQSNAKKQKKNGKGSWLAVKREQIEKRLAERKEKAEKKLAERKARAEKRDAERKAAAEKRAADRKAKAEKKAAEKEARIRERAHGKANRNDRRSKAKSNRRENRKKRNGERGERKGYGGWLAAVISLGAVTLALTTAVTVGAIDMKNTKESMMNGYKSTAYELMGIMEHVDDDLDRVRISASQPQQERILTDLLVQTRLAALDMEKMPVACEASQNVTSFVNRVGATCERMLTKLRLGGKLDQKDAETLERLYQTNHQIRSQLQEFTESMDDNMISQYMKKGEGMIKDVLQGLEELTLEENRSALEGVKEKMKEAGMERKGIPDSSEMQKSGAIDSAKAEEKCAQYFEKYGVKDFQCVGETVARGYVAYNLQGYDDKGTLLFAEVDVNSGELVRFNYYEECTKTNFDLDNSKKIAEEFLETLGYEDMTAARVSENGTDADFLFVYEQDDVLVYPDAIKIKICRERGVVTAFDAEKYLRHHKERAEQEPKISMETAKNNLHQGLSVENANLALVQARGGERLAYEFLCSYGEERYFIYTDATTGAEIAIVNVKNVG